MKRAGREGGSEGRRRDIDGSEASSVSSAFPKNSFSSLTRESPIFPTPILLLSSQVANRLLRDQDNYDSRFKARGQEGEKVREQRTKRRVVLSTGEIREMKKVRGSLHVVRELRGDSIS